MIIIYQVEVIEDHRELRDFLMKGFSTQDAMEDGLGIERIKKSRHGYFNQ